VAALSEAELALGQALLGLGLINRSQLLYAQRRHEVAEGSFAGQLVRLGLIGDHDMGDVVAEARSLPYHATPPAGEPKAEALLLCRREICQSLSFLPLAVDKGHLKVWLGEGNPEKVAEWVRRRLGLRVTCIQGPFSAVSRAIDKAYAPQRDNARESFDRERRRLEQDTQGSLGTEPMMQAMITLAGRDRATDIHIIPDAQSLLLAFRVDGVLSPIAAMPRSLARLVSSIKVSANMDIADNLRPQDGRFSFDGGGFSFDVRVSTAITPHGESVVMRLLSKSNFISGLEDLGFYPEHMPMLHHFFTQPYGIALMTGPTGSGKTTTLYAGLKPHGMSGKSILTVEDPVEYDLPSACQTQVNRKAGYTFDTAIRHFLRHDPDIMLVGEIRDSETAEAAMRASETGHLVLSTLHVNNVFSVPARLQSLGVSQLSIAESLIGVVTQRLVRRLCLHCRVLDDAPDSARPASLRSRLGSRPIYRAVGCAQCRDTGYAGRLPAYEILLVDAAVSQWIAEGAGRHALAGVLSSDNHVGMLDTCARRLLDGDTSLEEFHRMFGMIDEMSGTRMPAESIQEPRGGVGSSMLKPMKNPGEMSREIFEALRAPR
jgi:type II secretory ATPase GspE/PulE/Tfp pilus assembly ATPase PilB-like protein